MAILFVMISFSYANATYYIKGSKLYNLLEQCNSSDRVIASFDGSVTSMKQSIIVTGDCATFDGYIFGVIDTIDATNSYHHMNDKIKLPNPITPVQLRLVVMKYIKENPQELDRNASSIVINAILKTFGIGAVKLE